MNIFQWFNRIEQWLRPARIEGQADLAAFLNAQAAFVAQKSIVSYCQMKTRLHFADLIRDRAFAEAYDRARWETFEAVLGDLVLIVEGQLRSRGHGQASEAMARSLLGVFRSALEAHGHDAKDWGQGIARFERRLAQSLLAAPLTPDAITEHSAKRAFHALPIHADLRRSDAESFERSVQFLIVSAIERLERRADWGALARGLGAGSPQL
jgi:hypothetical protein